MRPGWVHRCDRVSGCRPLWGKPGPILGEGFIFVGIIGFRDIIVFSPGVVLLLGGRMFAGRFRILDGLAWPAGPALLGLPFGGLLHEVEAQVVDDGSRVFRIRVDEMLVAAFDDADLLHPCEVPRDGAVGLADAVRDGGDVFVRVPAVLVGFVGEADEDHPGRGVASYRGLVDGPGHRSDAHDGMLLDVCCFPVSVVSVWWCRWRPCGGPGR